MPSVWTRTRQTSSGGWSDVVALPVARGLRRGLLGRHALVWRRAVAGALLAGIAACLGVLLGVGPASADDCQPSEGGFCGVLSGPDSESGDSSFSGLFSPVSECSYPAYKVPVSELPSGSVPSWVPVESGQVCVQIGYSIPLASTPEEETPGTVQWQADTTAQLARFQLIGLFAIFLQAANFMRNKATVR